jgi:hypothetical protein
VAAVNVAEDADARVTDALAHITAHTLGELAREVARLFAPPSQQPLSFPLPLAVLNEPERRGLFPGAVRDLPSIPATNRPGGYRMLRSLDDVNRDGDGASEGLDLDSLDGDADWDWDWDAASSSSASSDGGDAPSSPAGGRGAPGYLPRGVHRGSGGAAWVQRGLGPADDAALLEPLLRNFPGWPDPARVPINSVPRMSEVLTSDGAAQAAAAAAAAAPPAPRRSAMQLLEHVMRLRLAGPARDAALAAAALKTPVLVEQEPEPPAPARNHSMLDRAAVHNKAPLQLALRPPPPAPPAAPSAALQAAPSLVETAAGQAGGGGGGGGGAGGGGGVAGGTLLACMCDGDAPGAHWTQAGPAADADEVDLMTSSTLPLSLHPSSLAKVAGLSLPLSPRYALLVPDVTVFRGSEGQRIAGAGDWRRVGVLLLPFAPRHYAQGSTAAAGDTQSTAVEAVAHPLARQFSLALSAAARHGYARLVLPMGRWARTSANAQEVALRLAQALERFPANDGLSVVVATPPEHSHWQHSVNSVLASAKTRRAELLAQRDSAAARPGPSTAQPGPPALNPNQNHPNRPNHRDGRNQDRPARPSRPTPPAPLHIGPGPNPARAGAAAVTTAAAAAAARWPRLLTAADRSANSSSRWPGAQREVGGLAAAGFPVSPPPPPPPPLSRGPASAIPARESFRRPDHARPGPPGQPSSDLDRGANRSEPRPGRRRTDGRRHSHHHRLRASNHSRHRGHESTTSSSPSLSQRAADLWNRITGQRDKSRDKVHR